MVIMFMVNRLWCKLSGQMTAKMHGIFNHDINNAASAANKFFKFHIFASFSAKLSDLNFYPLEVVFKLVKITHICLISTKHLQILKFEHTFISATCNVF